MNDADFLADLERRADDYVEYFTDNETARLWQLCGYRIPPYGIRLHYLQGQVKQHVAVARDRITKLVTERLTS